MLTTPTVLSLSPLPAMALQNFMQPYLGQRKVNIVAAVDHPPEQLSQLLSEADILLGDFTFNQFINAEVIAKLTKVKLIQQPSVGYQHIDIETCKQKNIPVANAAGANTVSVAEHTLMLALLLMKKTLYFHQQTSAGNWAQMDAFDKGIFELAGKTWGIVGMGRIGKALAKRLVAFEATVLYTDPIRLGEEEENKLGIQFLPLEKLISRVDILSLHAPLTESTRNMINENSFRKMKPGAYLINVARGELIDEVALASALKSKKIAGAGLDVFTHEPLNADNLLLKLPNVVLTPHLAGTTNEARARIIDISIKNIIRVLDGETPFNVVNL